MDGVLTELLRRNLSRLQWLWLKVFRYLFRDLTLGMTSADLSAKETRSYNEVTSHFIIAPSLFGTPYSPPLNSLFAEMSCSSSYYSTGNPLHFPLIMGGQVFSWLIIWIVMIRCLGWGGSAPGTQKNQVRDEDKGFLQLSSLISRYVPPT